ncbi:alpha/beta hydrolase [Variovorax ginsengisoli]|uniref:Alpha/beta hydrolase n=1 Tax=Variovorax ginsengisoli TaxID=363844 RepID=A0ABT8SGM1_9BURK|nr:alpha/beta hydrolase [Variovorax ginsengisoli]MDN8618896.1 alpha/beta hydrolase [Variovorax ginsengisoli]MDO1538066.1 alpha/beta hydrolase [Variovorax ginsengisoli]
MNDVHPEYGSPADQAGIAAARRLAANLAGKVCLHRLRLAAPWDLSLVMEAEVLGDMEPELGMELVAVAFESFLGQSSLSVPMQAEADKFAIAIARWAAPYSVPVDELIRIYFRHYQIGEQDKVEFPYGSASQVILGQSVWTLGRADALVVQQRIAHFADTEGGSAQRVALELETHLASLRATIDPPLCVHLSRTLEEKLREDVEVAETASPRWMKWMRPGKSASPEHKEQSVECIVWYGTNRQPVDANDGAKGYGKARGQRLEVGRCAVVVPKARAFGSTGSNAVVRWLTGSDDRIRVIETTPLARERQWQEMRDALQGSRLEAGRRDVLLYIHGYKTSFEQAAIRAAQLHVDLGVPGVTAFYSWPSRGTFLGYFADEAAIDASEAHLAQFIQSLCEQLDSDRVHVLAHSMGNRGLVRALAQLAAARTESLCIGQIFLAAPDVDVELFTKLASVYSEVSERTSLYISRRDRAVWMSLFLHRFPRVGYAPPVTIVEGIDTIEVSAIDFSQLGHGAYAEAEPLLYDMGGLLRNDMKPAHRLRLRSIENEEGCKYWALAR